jgi:hypothetical protein
VRACVRACVRTLRSAVVVAAASSLHSPHLWHVCGVMVVPNVSL